MFVRIIFSALGIAITIALVVFGLMILIPLLIGIWIYIILVKKNIIKRPGFQAGEPIPPGGASGDIIDAEYEVIDENDHSPKS